MQFDIQGIMKGHQPYGLPTDRILEAMGSLFRSSKATQALAGN